MRELWLHRDFRLLLLAQTLSMFGEWTLLLVFGIWAKALTGSNAIAGLTVFAMAAPGLLAPLTGLWVDRLPRRLVVVALNTASCFVLASLWLVRDSGQVWLLFAVAAWSGLAGVTRNAAITALVQSMLSADRVGTANGALATVRQGLRLVGPLVGAGLFTTAGGGWVATMNVVAFLGASIMLLRLRHREHTAEAPEVPFAAELVAGLAHLWRCAPLRRLGLATVAFSCAIGLFEPTVYALVDDGLGRAPGFIGVLVSVQGAGALLGGVLVSLLIRHVSEVHLVTTALIVLAIGAGLCAVPRLAAALTGFALLGVGLPVMAVAVATLLQRMTSPAVMGRTAASYDMIGNVPTTASIAAGAVLVARWPYEAILGVSALGCALAALVMVGGAPRHRRALDPAELSNATTDT